MDIETIESQIVYRNRWMTVREDKVRRRDGSPGLYGVVEKPDFAVVIPLDGDRLHLVEQFRYPVRARFWEFPQGSWESDPAADPALVARAELAEETGLRAERIDYLGELFGAYGYATQAMHVFLATGLSAAERQLSREEQDLITESVTRAEFEGMIRDGRIKDAATVAAYALLRLIEADAGRNAERP